MNSFFIDQAIIVVIDFLSGVFVLDMLLRFIHGYSIGRVKVLDLKPVAIHYLT